jgi:UDP-glucose 4-epimerase
MPMTILITGGAGFIGSHTVLELLNVGHTVICVDNGCNAYIDAKEKLPESLKRVQEITEKTVIFYNVDIRDKNALGEVFKKVSFYLFNISIIHYTIGTGGGVGRCEPVTLNPFSSAM